MKPILKTEEAAADAFGRRGSNDTSSTLTQASVDGKSDAGRSDDIDGVGKERSNATTPSPSRKATPTPATLEVSAEVHTSAEDEKERTKRDTKKRGRARFFKK